ncbi:MAG TPA: 3'(2'),5'-bisphosphate nucleotidase CysQ [Mycobacteriales bacterium]|nr:3'(2'),5'-bisphosphate nucleotidase CysQ [Mycobacteriales bacterium]
MTTDAALAARLATEAGELLLKVRDSVPEDDRKAQGDRQAHEFLVAALAAARPDDAVLSEEGKDDPIRLTSDRVWIVDPLDGTREFGEGDRTDWAVHVALWERGELTAGAVALPAQGVTFCSDAPPVLPTLGDPLRLVVSRSRPPALVTALAEALGAELVPMGSAGAKAMSVLQGTSDAYVHGGGQYEWDSAAPVVVARAAGLHTSRLDGSPLVYNQEDVLLPDLVVCQPSVASRLLEALATL